MAALDFSENTFDLIWAEGSAYIIGFEKALHLWKSLLKKPGYLAATEVTWIKSNYPEEVRHFWAEEYPAIQDIEANQRLFDGRDIALLGTSYCRSQPGGLTTIRLSKRGSRPCEKSTKITRRRSRL